jgi:hypothetical protein
VTTIFPIQPSAGAVPSVVVIQPQPSNTTLIESWTPYLPLVLTMIGWIIVSRQHDRRERRKEIRDLIKLIELRVDDVLRNATEYYALDGDDPKCQGVGFKMRYGISGIDPLQKRLRAAGLNVKINDELVVFRQAVTGGSFESSVRKKNDTNGSIMAEAAASGFELVGKLEETYFAAFPAKVRSFGLF